MAEMKVDIWSDIRCPFCYIGKHAFENALARFDHHDRVEVVWHSFELDPFLETRPGLSLNDHLAELKGLSAEDVEAMHLHVSQMGEKVGVRFAFSRAVVANSFHAHRLIQLAKASGKGNEAEEALFKAYFTEGVNIDDPGALLPIGTSLGLPEERVRELLFSDALSREVRADERQAAELGIRGVPFFVFNQRYAVSGAQSPEVFLQTLDTAWKEFEKTDLVTVVDGEACSSEGTCE